MFVTKNTIKRVQVQNRHRWTLSSRQRLQLTVVLPKHARNWKSKLKNF